MRKIRYPRPHRKMYLAWLKGKGIKLSHTDLERLFRDDAMITAATQREAEDSLDIKRKLRKMDSQ